MPRRLQGRLGPVVFVSAVAALIASGCDATGDGTSTDYVAVCTDKAGNRVDDSKCQRAPDTYDNDGFDAGDAFLWYYLGTANASAYAPGIGQRVTGGVYRTPVTVRNTTINIGSGNTKTSSGSTSKQTVQRGGVASSGASITRGGLGVSSGSGSGSSTKGGSSGSSSKSGSGSSSSGGRGSSGSAGS